MIDIQRIHIQNTEIYHDIDQDNIKSITLRINEPIYQKGSHVSVGELPPFFRVMFSDGGFRDFPYSSISYYDWIK